MGHHDLLVVGLVDRGNASDHESRWKSLGSLIDLLVAHCAGALAIQGLNEAEEVALKVVRVRFLHRCGALLDSVGLQLELLAVLLLDDQRMLFLHLFVDLRKRIAISLSLAGLLLQTL